jgi:hypothetical protein
MTTDVEQVLAAVESATDENADLRTEIERLVELTKHKIDRNDQTPCPSCTILVHVQLNHCPHCESDIAAHNALLRESVRRIGEIQTEIDGQHHEHVDRRDSDSAKPPLGERFKRFFSGAGTVEESGAEGSIRNEPDASVPRILSDVSPGDQVKVLESDGPWLKVKTRAGKTGWVYSTLVKE